MALRAGWRGACLGPCGCAHRRLSSDVHAILHLCAELGEVQHPEGLARRPERTAHGSVMCCGVVLAVQPAARQGDRGRQPLRNVTSWGTTPSATLVGRRKPVGADYTLRRWSKRRRVW